jgi:hypothetical protein
MPEVSAAMKRILCFTPGKASKSVHDGAARYGLDAARTRAWNHYHFSGDTGGKTFALTFIDTPGHVDLIEGIEAITSCLRMEP